MDDSSLGESREKRRLVIDWGTGVMNSADGLLFILQYLPKNPLGILNLFCPGFFVPQYLNVFFLCDKPGFFPF